MIKLIRFAYRWFRNTFKLYESEDKIIADAQKFWNDPEKIEDGQYTHFRGSGIFQDDEKWLAVGRQSLEIFQELSCAVPYEKPVTAALEWGCGGGANAVHFAPLVKTFYGLDISQECTVECSTQLNREGFSTHRMVTIDAANPEKALEEITEKLDLFYCLYVIELLPSKAYTERILAIASKMLKPGGMAFLQYKYTTSDWQSGTKRWNYASNPINMVSYWTDEFWTACETHGLKPQVMKLLPVQPLVNDCRYAYVLCVKE